MHKTTRLKIADINPHLLCVLCGGYFIDATCIIECLHSFCRSCITKYLEGSKCCPICDVQVHKTRPLLNLRPDKSLQTLVYKLIPGLYREEMSRRRQFYAKNPDAAPNPSLPNASEDRGESDPDRFQTQEQPEKYSLVLQHCDRLPLPSNAGRGKCRKPKTTSDKRYLLCPSNLSIAHLKRFLRCKFDIQTDYQVELFYHGDETLADDYTLADVAYVYSWSRTEPLRIFYVVLNKKEVCLGLSSPASCPIVVPTVDEEGSGTEHTTSWPNPECQSVLEANSAAQTDLAATCREDDAAEISTEVNASFESSVLDKELTPEESTCILSAEDKHMDKGDTKNSDISATANGDSCTRDELDTHAASPVFLEQQEDASETHKEHSRKHSHKKKKKKKKHRRSRSKVESKTGEIRSAIKVRISKDKISPLVSKDSVFEALDDCAYENMFHLDDKADAINTSGGDVSGSPDSEGRASGSLEDSGVDPGEDLIGDLIVDRISSLDSLSPQTPKLGNKSIDIRVDNKMEADIPGDQTHVDDSDIEVGSMATGSLAACLNSSSVNSHRNTCDMKCVKDKDSTTDKTVERIRCTSQSADLESRLPELGDFPEDSPDILCAEEMSFLTDSEADSSFDSSQPRHKEYTCQLSLDGKVLLHSSKAKEAIPQPIPALGIVVEDTPPEIIVVDSDTGLNVDSKSLPSNGYHPGVNGSVDNSSLDSRSLGSVSPQSRQSVTISDEVETDMSVLVEVDESGSLVHASFSKTHSPILGTNQTSDNQTGTNDDATSGGEILTSARTNAHVFKKDTKIQIKKDVGYRAPVNVHSSLSPPCGEISLKRHKTTESGCALKQPKLEHSHKNTGDLNGGTQNTSSMDYFNHTKGKPIVTGVHSSLSPPNQHLNRTHAATVSVNAHGYMTREFVPDTPPLPARANAQRQIVSSVKRSPRRGPLKERPVTLPVSRTVIPAKSCTSAAPLPRPYSSLPYPIYQTHVHPSLSAITAQCQTAPGAFSPPPVAMEQLRLMCGDVLVPPTPGHMVRHSLPPGFPPHPATGFLHSRHFLSPIFSPPMPNRSLPSPLSPTRASPLSPNHFAPVSPAHFAALSPPRLSPPGLPGLGVASHLQVPGYDSPLELTTHKAQDRHSAVVSVDRS